jgi:hypothetical protein
MANFSVSVYLPDRPNCTLESLVAKSTYVQDGIQTMRKLSTSLRELQTSDSISPELFNEVAQLGHFAGGLAVIWGSIVLFGSGSVWWAFGTLAVVAGVKEFWWTSITKAQWFAAVTSRIGASTCLVRWVRLFPPH